MRRIFLVTLLVLVVGRWSIHSANAMQPVHQYTIDEVITAYDSGQVRAIPVGGSPVEVSGNGKYVAATGDGIYRISDGVRLERIDGDALFSADGKYVAVADNSVIRLSDWQRVLNIKAEA